MSDEEYPDPWSTPAYGAGAAPPPPPPPGGGEPPTIPQPTTGMPAGAGAPTQPIPAVRGPGGPRPPVPPPPGGVPEPSGQRRPAVLWLAIGVGLAALVALLVVLLNRDDTTDADTDVTTTLPLETTVATTLPPETTVPVVEETTTTPAPTTEAPTTTAPPTTLGPDPTGWPSGLVLTVAADDGVRNVGEHGSNELVVQQGFTFALPIPGRTDFMVQSGRGRTESGTDTAIRVVAPDGSDTTIVEAGPGTYLRLHDVRQTSSGLTMLYSIDQGDSIEDQVESLVWYRFDDGSTLDLGPSGGWEEGTGRLHIGGVTIVGEHFAEVVSSLFSRRPDGTQIDPASLGLEPQYVDCSTCPRRFTISPNGQRLAWIDGNELVVVDLGTGAEIHRAGLPGDLGATTADVTLGNNDLAILNRTPSGSIDEPFLNAVLVDLANGPLFIDVPVAGFAAGL